MPRAKGNTAARLDRARVSAVAVNVQLDRYPGLEERIVEFDCLPRVRCVIQTSAGQEGRGGVRRRSDVHASPTSIDQADEIGTTTLALNRIGGLWLAAIKANVGERGQGAP